MNVYRMGYTHTHKKLTTLVPGSGSSEVISHTQFPMNNFLKNDFSETFFIFVVEKIIRSMTACCFNKKGNLRRALEKLHTIHLLLPELENFLHGHSNVCVFSFFLIVAIIVPYLFFRSLQSSLEVFFITTKLINITLERRITMQKCTDIFE